MASIKTLKKEVEAATLEFATDCYMLSLVCAHSDDVDSLFEEAAERSEQIRARISSYDRSPGREASKMRKQHFNTIRSEYTALFKEMNERLTGIVDKSEK